MKRVLTFCFLALVCAASVWAQDTLYVKPAAASTAWAGHDAYTSLEAALADAQAGDQIWVADGIYVAANRFPNGTDNRCRAFVLKSGVSLYGGFAGTETDISQRAVGDNPWEFVNSTVLSGDISNTPNTYTDDAYHVLYGGYNASTYASNVVVDGFTIVNGYANRNGYLDDQKGGGVLFGLQSVLRNCIIHDCYATGMGGGAYMPNSSIMENCLFHDNAALSASSGGGAAAFANCDYATVVASGCVFSNNTCSATNTSSSFHYGGGALSTGNNCTFESCDFLNNGSQNLGGAVYCGNSNEFNNCLFVANYAVNGGAIYGGSASNLVASNCLFNNNVASANGGAVNITGYSCRCINSTFVNNDAADNSAIHGGSGVTVFNCILWHDGVTASHLVSTDANCLYTAILGTLASGQGNLNVTTEEIAFRNPGTILPTPATEDDLNLMLAADYSLSGASVCRDAGSLATLSLSGYDFPATDFAGMPRVNNGIIDLGCYEIQCSETLPVLTLTVGDTLYNDSIPGVATLTLHFAIDEPLATCEYTLAVNGEVFGMTDGEYDLTVETPATLNISIIQLDTVSECSMHIDTTVVFDSIFNINGIVELPATTLHIFPNPASDYVQVHCTSSFPQNAEWQLLDLTGRLILTQPATSENTQINLTHCQTGVYILRFVSEGRTVATARIVRQ
jgi:hypothetical protein